MKIKPDFKTFVRLSKQGNTIPVYAEMLADLETPVSSYLKVCDNEGFLLESVEGGTNQARFSFVGMSPEEMVTHNGSRAIYHDIRGKQEEWYRQQQERIVGLEHFVHQKQRR